MAKKPKWVVRSRTYFWPTRKPHTTWLCCHEGDQPNRFGEYVGRCGKNHTTQLGAERHCRKLNEGESK